MGKISFKEFRDKTYGKKIGVSWGFVGECVSLVQQGLHDMYNVPLKRRGNAKDYGNNIIKNGLGYLVDTPRYGDLLVWGASLGGGYGHVAFYNDGYTMYDQNNTSKLPARTAQIRNNLKQKPMQIIRMYETLKPDIGLDSSGSFKFDNDIPIKVRNGRVGKKGEDTGLRYTKGQVLKRYDGVYELDGNTWLTYISASGVRRSIAVGDENGLWGYNI